MNVAKLVLGIIMLCTFPAVLGLDTLWRRAHHAEDRRRPALKKAMRWFGLELGSIGFWFGFGALTSLGALPFGPNVVLIVTLICAAIALCALFVGLNLLLPGLFSLMRFSLLGR